MEIVCVVGQVPLVLEIIEKFQIFEINKLTHSPHYTHTKIKTPHCTLQTPPSLLYTFRKTIKVNWHHYMKEEKNEKEIN